MSEISAYEIKHKGFFLANTTNSSRLLRESSPDAANVVLFTYKNKFYEVTIENGELRVPYNDSNSADKSMFCEIAEDEAINKLVQHFQQGHRISEPAKAYLTKARYNGLPVNYEWEDGYSSYINSEGVAVTKLCACVCSCGVDDTRLCFEQLPNIIDELKSETLSADINMSSYTVWCFAEKEIGSDNPIITTAEIAVYDDDIAFSRQLPLSTEEKTAIFNLLNDICAHTNGVTLAERLDAASVDFLTELAKAPALKPSNSKKNIDR